MAERPSVFFKAPHSLMWGEEAQRIRRRFGHVGMDRFVSMLCLLIDEDDGCVDVSDDEGAEIVAERLWFDDADGLREFAAYLAGRGLLDADALGSGVLRAPIVDDGITSWARARRGGRKSSDA